MSEIGEDEVCELACSPTLDGYTPNPLYSSGACPDYMKSECNMGGALWQKQWDLHQDRLKLFNSERIFNASMGVPTQVVGYQPQHQYQQQYSPLLPPTSAQVFATMRHSHPHKFKSQTSRGHS